MNVYAQDTLRLGIGVPKRSVYYAAIEDVILELNKKTGITFILIPLSFNDEEFELTTGKIDGGISRTKFALQRFKNIKIVPQKLFDIKYYTLGKRGTLLPHGMI